MVFRMKVKRDWDRACEKAEIALGAIGVLNGVPAMLVSVEMSLSHVITLEFLCGEFVASSHSSKQIKYWLRSFVRSHR
jgi:hypothetical protein